MEYKIYVLSSKTSQLPYDVGGVQQTTVEGALNALNERGTTGAYVTNHKLFI